MSDIDLEDPPEFGQEEVAKSIFRMESKLHNIDGATGLMQHELEEVRSEMQTMQEIALAFRDYHLHTHGGAARDAARQLRHIKLLLFVIAVVATVKLFA